MTPSTPRRNDPCPCGSGRKYKACCLKADRKATHAGARSVHLTPEMLEEIRRVDVWQTELIPYPVSFADDPGARPALALLAARGWALAAELHRRPSGEPEAVAALLAEGVLGAVERIGRPPKRLEVRHAEVAAALQGPLVFRGIEVVLRERLPELDALGVGLIRDLDPEEVASGERAVAASSETWGGWALEAGRVRDVFDAAAHFYRAHPWSILTDEARLDLEMPEGEVWGASVLGWGGIELGLSIYSDPRDRDRLLSLDPPGANALDDFRGRCLSLTFDTTHRLPPRTRREVSREGWPVADADAFPSLLTVNTPGGGVSDADARTLALALRAVGAATKHLEGAWGAGTPAEWQDPETGVGVRLGRRTHAVGEPGAFARQDRDQTDLFDFDPRRRRVDDRFLDEAFRGDPWLGDGFLDDDDDEDADLPWDPPEVLAPGAVEGEGADPGSALRALADPDAVDAEAAWHAELLEGFRHWSTGGARREERRKASRTAGATATVERLLAFLRSPEGTSLRALHERDLRVFLYRSLPERAGPRWEAELSWAGYFLQLEHLERFFRFLDDAEGLSCPWAAGILDDHRAFLHRWETYPGPAEEPDLEGLGDPEEEETAQTLLEEASQRFVAHMEWDDLLETDLAWRGMEPVDATADGGSWMEALSPPEWDLHRELARRWLLWREEAIAAGATDLDDVVERAVERQRAWERTRHPRLGGRTPLQAVADEWEIFEREIASRPTGPVLVVDDPAPDHEADPG